MPSPPAVVPTYGAIVSRAAGPLSMQVYAYLGTSQLIALPSALQWKTVEVAFAGGSVDSVVAEHGLSATIGAGGTVVGVGDLLGSGLTYPSGLAFTVTFASGTLMDGVRIDFASPATSITTDDPAVYPTVEWSATPAVATVVQDTAQQLYAFAPAHDILTIEVGLSSSTSGLSVAPLVGGVSATIGSDFFGLARLDGQGIPLAQGVALAAASRVLDIEPDHARTAVVSADIASPFTYVAYVVGAAFAASPPSLPPSQPPSLPPTMPPMLPPPVLPPPSLPPFLPPSTPPSLPPATPPALPPAVPGGAIKPLVMLTFVAAGTIESFDEAAFKAGLAALLAEGVEPRHVTLVVSAASVRIEASIVMDSAAAADAVTSTLSTATPADLTSALGVIIEQVRDRFEWLCYPALALIKC